uniref:Uncharacterized protein n=1 Tax=Sphaerodactylus townsendi TaxID=933632 RepID=A0ACB8E645_9SAUR
MESDQTRTIPLQGIGRASHRRFVQEQRSRTEFSSQCHFTVSLFLRAQSRLPAKPPLKWFCGGPVRLTDRSPYVFYSHVLQCFSAIAQYYTCYVGRDGAAR